MIKRFLAWLRSRQVKRNRVWIEVNRAPESRNSNWYSGHRNVQDEDKQKMRGHLTR